MLVLVEIVNVSALTILILYVVVYFMATTLSTSGKISLKIRKLPAVDAMEEAVGRCAEMGSPLTYTIGQCALSGQTAPMAIAGLSSLAFVADKCAKTGVDIVSIFGYADEVLIAEGLLKDAYTSQGLDLKPGMVRYTSPQGYAWTAYVIGVIQREKPAANILIGQTTGETMGIVEAGSMVGALQIGGSTQIVMLPYIVVGCDYSLIMEEIYAVGAYISKDPYETGSLAFQDYSRLIIIAMLVVGTILHLFGIDAMINLLSLG